MGDIGEVVVGSRMSVGCLDFEVPLNWKVKNRDHLVRQIPQYFEFAAAVEEEERVAHVAAVVGSLSEAAAVAEAVCYKLISACIWMFALFTYIYEQHKHKATVIQLHLIW